jgi:hypothetical protein
VHARHAGNKLRASENHASATEDVVDKVEHHEDAMCIYAVSDANELKRCVSVRDAKLGHYSQDGHQSDLERQAACPPDRQSHTPAVSVRGTDDTFVDPPAQRMSASWVRRP